MRAAPLRTRVVHATEVITVNPSESREELEKLERKHADNPEGRYFVPLANAYRKVGEIDRAIAVLREGLETNRDYLSAHIVLGRCLADRGDTAAAESEFRYVLSLDSQNLIALRTLGELALGGGRIEDARRWYRELLTVDPMNEDARRALDGIQVIPGSAGSAPRPSTHAIEPPAVPGWQDATRPSPDPSRPEQLSTAANDAFGMDPEAGDRRAGAFAADGPGVVTETIAELYTRQGFYDRAAEVYRELLRRRGPNPDLEDRLRRVEELGRSEESPRSDARRDQDAPAPSAPSAAAPAPRSPDPASAVFDTTIVTTELAADATSTEPDPLAPDLAAAAAHEQPSPLDLADLGFGGPPPAVHAAAPSLASGFADTPLPTDSPADGASIREYLQTVLSWTPEAAPPLGESGVTPAPTLHDLPSAGPQVEPVRPVPDSAPLQERAENDWLQMFEVTLGEDEPAGIEQEERTSPSVTPVAGLESDLFPWEVPEDDSPISETSDLTTSPPLPDVATLPMHVLDAEPEPRRPPSDPAPPPAAPAAHQPSPAEASPPPAPPANAAAEEDDLESFQAWLRSLKR